MCNSLSHLTSSKIECPLQMCGWDMNNYIYSVSMGDNNKAAKHYEYTVRGDKQVHVYRHDCLKVITNFRHMLKAKSHVNSVLPMLSRSGRPLSYHKPVGKETAS